MELLHKLKNFVWSKHFLKHLGLVLFSYLLIVTIAVFYLDSITNHGQRIDVPNLIGQNVNNVKNKLVELELQYEVLDSIYDPTKPEGTILDQDPDPTTLSLVPVKSGRIIRLRVSKKTRLVDMPSLVDKSERFAISILENRGLTYVKEYKPSNEANGAVLEQRYKGRSIKEGEKVPIGAKIVLIIGQNDAGEPVDIPDLYGLTLAEARELLLQMGEFALVPVCADCITSEDSLAAKIESQTPEYVEGITIPSRSTITVYATKDFNNAPKEP
jgi:beta-lactam-binding protein with PASTA domain